jgi:D-arabinose 1-dehydrogenase-like Zn-dependent alcohol dehydrogenase
MRAIRYEAFGADPQLTELPDPVCPPRGAVIDVRATGVCRSDWHAWQGHDDSVALPHTPGHEFAGVVREVAPEVTRFRVGDRVTAPFILSCGRCAQCRAGATQVCPDQHQPGFDLAGSYAEQVVVIEADHNLVALPDGIDMLAAAGLGCRFGTAFHAVRSQARVQAGECVVVLGCGGVGLSALQIAAASGARVIAVDVSEGALEAARALGAEPVPTAPDEEADDLVERLLAASGGGADVTIDALGSARTAAAGIRALRPRGRHVQVGLLLGGDADPSLPMGRVIGLELQLLGSHGLAAGEYRELLREIADGHLDPAAHLGSIIGLEDLPDALTALGRAPTGAGMTVAAISPR